MNKQHYRLVFNMFRGVLMAVAEHIAGSGKSTQETQNQGLGTGGWSLGKPKVNTSKQTYPLKPTHFAVLCHLGMVSLVGLSTLSNLAHADIIADKSAPKNQQPIILNAPNGVPLVNIQTPSAAGVSRNTYSQFDVNSNGAILNNSRTNVQTQLGGWVQGNPYLATGSARIILNEVNSQNPSLLNGYVEVAGSRVQVVIANPAGISCNGCGFINASRATLTTGAPMLNGGDLIGYRVTGGVINFLGAGLDTANANYTDVIARAVNVNAGIWAQNLNIITGSNQVNVSGAQVASDSYISSIAAGTTSGSAPTFAVDVAALGGMYAGKIHLIGTEAGLGVRNAGTIGASVGEVTIDVNGQLTNRNHIGGATQAIINAGDISNTGGRITAGQLLNVNAASLSGDGDLLSGGDTAIYLTTDYTQVASGKTQANGNLSLSTTGDIANQGNLLAGNTLSLNAANIDNIATAEITGLNTHINAANTLTNQGLIDGSDTFITAATLNNIGTGSIFGDHVAIAANMLNNLDETVGVTTQAAIIAARTRLDIGATNINNREQSLMFSSGDMAIGRALDANHQATGQAITLNNTSATIEAHGNLSLNIDTINNTNTHLTTQYVRTSVASTLAESVDVRGNIASPAPAAGNTRQYQLSYHTTNNPLLFGRVYNYDDVDHFYLDGSGFAHLVLKAGVANDGMTDADTFMQYNSGSLVYETQMLTTQPGQILAGNNMQIETNSLLNSDSKMIAGSTFNANAATLSNQETLGSRSTQYGSESAFFRTRESCNCSRYFQYPNYPAPVIESINLGSSAYGAVSTVTGTGTTVATLTSNNIPINSLFTPTTNPQSGYLIETNPRFANYRSWLSSDYMLTALNLDPALSTKRLGDGFYEQRIIREQINTLTGRRFLVGYADDEAQYQALMSNGATFATSHQLVPGVALTAAQVAQLTSDIVWLVEQTVTLPNGTTTKALVPQVYARLQANDLSPTGSLIAGQTLHLNVSGNVINGGDLAGRDAISLNANNIHNINGRMRANNTQITATNDINNLGGSIEGRDTLSLHAGNNINVESTTASSTLTFDLDQGNRIIHVDNKRTNIDRVAGLYITNPSGTGLLVASAGNDINLQGAVISNAGDNSLTVLNANNDIKLGTIATSSNNSYVRNARNYQKNSSTEEVGTVIQTEGDLSLNAGNNLSARAADVTSSNGALNVTANNDLTIEAGKATYASESASYSKKKGIFSSKSKTRRDTTNGTDVISSTFSGNNVNIAAGNNLAVKASNIVGTNDVNLNAGNNVTLTTEQATHDETHYSKTKKSGFTASTTSIGYGSSKLTNTNDSQQVINVGSTVGSVEGNVNINVGKTYTQTGSDVLTPQGNIDITAQQVNIINATDTYANQQSMKYKQTGITLAISNPVVSAVQTTNQMVKASKQTSDPRMQALAAATTALAVNNAAEAVAKSPDTLGGVNLSLSIGTSKSSSKTVQTNSTAKSSTLNAGGDVNVAATGAGKDSDINVIGSTIKATNDVTLKAEDQINLQAAQNVDTLNSKNKSSSASVGVSVGTTSGFAVTASASQGKGKANGTDVAWTETQIQSGNGTGDTVTLQSGTDTTLKGAQVTGNQVVANVGTSGQGNLNIESLQDTSTYKSKQSSAGISVSVPIGAGSYGGSISASNSKTKSDYASVNEQSGIMAGDGGFQVSVNGNTDLKGAVIASTEKAIQNNTNSLTTQTLTVSNIKNKAEYKADAMSVSVGGGTQSGKPTLSGAGVGSDSGDASSTTVSGIGGGTISITDNGKQQALTGQDATTTVALLNRDVKVNENGEVVNRSGNSTANTIAPIFDAEKAQKEIAAQVKITLAFSQEAPRVLNTFVQEKIKPYQDARKVVSETEALLAKVNQSDESQIAYKAELQDKINHAYETMAETQADYDKWNENGEYRIASNIIIAAISGGASNAATAATKESLSWAADVMRQNMIEDSKKFPGICVSKTDCISNMSGESVGVNGDGKKVAGGRVVLADWCKAGGEGGCVPDTSTLSGWKQNEDGTVIFKPKDANGNDLSINEFIDQHQELRSPLGGVQGGAGQMALGVQFEYVAGSFWDKLAEAYSGTHDTLNSFIWYDELGNGKNLNKTLIGKVGEAANYTNVLIATPFAYSVLLPPEVWNAVFTLIKSK
jgi:filamentous hemagglutinin